MNILMRPVITEKSMSGTQSGRYIFEVRRNANAPEVAREIESLYKVKVKKINMINIKGEEKTVRGRYAIQTRKWKKAIITLEKGQKIPGFEEK